MKLQSYFPLFKYNKLFLRILFSFLSLLLPIAILGALFYHNHASNMERNFSNKITENLQTSASTINSYLRTVRETNTLLFADSTFSTLLKPNSLYTLEERTALPIIPRRIAQVENLLAEYVDRVFVYVDSEIVYVGEGIEDFQTFFERIYSFDQFTSSFWLYQIPITKTFEVLRPSIVGKSKNRQVITIPVVMHIHVNNHNAVMVATLSSDALHTTLKGNAIFPTTEFVILDATNQLLLSTADQFKHISGSFNPSQRSYEKMEIDGKRYLISFVKGDIYGWQYFSITPLSEFKQITSSFLQLIVVISLMLMFIGVVLSVLFSLSLYNPIRKIRDILIDQEEASNNSIQIDLQHDDFALIGKKIKKMVAYNQKYKTGLNELSTDYVDSALHYLFRGGRGSIQNEHKLAELLMKHFDQDVGEYVVCGISFHFNEIFYQEIQDVERLIIHDKLKNVIWGLLSEQVNCYIIEYRENLYIAILQLPITHGREELKRVLHQIMTTFQYDVRYCDIHIGISKTYPNLDFIDRSFGEAMTVLGARDVKRQFQVYYADELSSETVMYSYTLSDEKKIMNGLKIGDQQYLQNKIMEQIHSNREKGVSPANISLLVIELYNTGKRYVTEKGLQVFQLISSEEDRFLISNSNDLMEIERKVNILTAFYDRIVQITYSPEDKRMGTLVSMIMAYIEENYYHDLHLEKIAEEMGSSAKYLSKLFKENTSINLTDYISLTRIAKSKRLLQETNLNIDDIGEQVGIYSRTTFLRLFKKHEGITPSQYRKIGNDEE